MQEDLVVKKTDQELNFSREYLRTSLLFDIFISDLGGKCEDRCNLRDEIVIRAVGVVVVAIVDGQRHQTVPQLI